ncbi:ABC transporter [Megasphaera cerevisiae DSM 20462]|uniref:Transport permease protein n=1 Tax=Megasphaera cerevisiae DSM 20462 TaxID=1122219 RepID=A0A0J6WTW7_9FIRM|nr:ABC transporter permease [Megasphaera cerevisiae]KMO85979.1 ABC transporter [Megasphaera cerevisiae DSM 20462]SKA13194.1 lipopolysaccharide transport system permease protein [Megasphaera cerevisiae DSM 20462]
MLASLKKILKYKYLLCVLVERDIKTKYRRSVLGVLWSMLNPLLMMIITAMVFSTLFRFAIENYVLYLLVGQVAFTFFAESTNFAMGSILQNGALIKKVYVPKYLFPASRVMSSCVNLLFTVPAIVIMMLYTGQTPTWRIISFIIPLILMLAFCMGVGLILSACVIYFRDIYHLYGVLLTALNYATPIFYPESIVPAQYQWILTINPLYYYVKGFREVVYNDGIPELHTMGICFGIAMVFLVAGILIFRKVQNQFILYI